jgi:hypothetical protein
MMMLKRCGSNTDSLSRCYLKANAAYLKAKLKLWQCKQGWADKLAKIMLLKHAANEGQGAETFRGDRMLQVKSQGNASAHHSVSFIILRRIYT